VVATKFYQQADIDYLRAALPEIDFWFPRKVGDLKFLKNVAGEVDIFLGPPPSSDILKNALGSLKMIQIPWSGLDGMDFSTCKEHSILCANSHTNAASVAELAVTLCLDVLKLTPFHHSAFCNGFLHRPGSLEGFFPPRLLTGKSVGILGFGSIGKEIYRLLTGFDLQFATVSRSGVKFDHILNYDRDTEFSDFLGNSEILFITAPLTVETENILNEDSLSQIRKGAIIINVSRAELIDVRALYESLMEERISGVALDVHWKNISPEEQALVDEICHMKNVVMSPHRGGFVAGELPHLDGAITNIRKVYEGRMMEINGVIDFDKGY